MRSIGRMTSLAVAASLVAAQASAADGVAIVQKVTGSGAAVTHQIDIDAHRMRMETGGGPAGSQVFVFDGTRQVMLMINDAKKTYSEITKADIDALSGQMSAAMAQMQDAMKNMPPERRAQMEAMMKGRMGGAIAAATPSKPQYKRVGTGTVGKWTCDKYEGYTEGKKTAELCTVDPKVLGLGAADTSVTKDFAEFFSKLPIGNAIQAFHIGNPEQQGFSGVPVRSVVTTSDGQTITSEITDVHRQSFEDAIFQAPAGYQKQDSPFGAIGRGRRGR